jgi:hypothetical protein
VTRSTKRHLLAAAVATTAMIALPATAHAVPKPPQHVSAKAKQLKRAAHSPKAGKAIRRHGQATTRRGALAKAASYTLYRPCQYNGAYNRVCVFYDTWSQAFFIEQQYYWAGRWYLQTKFWCPAAGMGCTQIY